MSVSRSIHGVAAALTRRGHQFIRFPRDGQEQRSIKQGFYDMSNFPNCLGAVDGTLVPILAPSEDEHLYITRKGFHALNVQVVCDANNEFLNIVTKWPGSTHDSHIWNTCTLSQAFENHEITTGYLVGDSAYRLTPYMMTLY